MQAEAMQAEMLREEEERKKEEQSVQEEEQEQELGASGMFPTCSHCHPLQLISTKDIWCCDVRSADCQAKAYGFLGSSATWDVSYWHCRLCDFDMCRACYTLALLS